MQADATTVQQHYLDKERRLGELAAIITRNRPKNSANIRGKKAY